MKRVFDVVLSTAILSLASPLLVLIVFSVWFDSGRPIFFSQERIGKDFCRFRLWKFRTMKVVNDGPRLTVKGDPRVTRAGKWLRLSKLDELPQFFNVLAGEMSIVGPRPEVHELVMLCEGRFRKVLALRPGITDLASIEFRNEEDVLARSSDPMKTYREEILPAKLDLAETYLKTRNVLMDLRIILQTIVAVLRPRRPATQHRSETSTR